MATGLSPAERIACIYGLLGEAFQAEALANHIGSVAVNRDAGGDPATADALRAMARTYRVRALKTWGDIALLGSAPSEG